MFDKILIYLGFKKAPVEKLNPGKPFLHWIEDEQFEGHYRVSRTIPPPPMTEREAIAFIANYLLGGFKSQYDYTYEENLTNMVSEILYKYSSEFKEEVLEDMRKRGIDVV